MSGFALLQRALLLVEKHFQPELKSISFEPRLARIQAELHTGILIFIRYNDRNEYSYSIIFSNLELDRCRFDNHDDRWKVPTRPHHFHPRMKREGLTSPMNGNPDQDVPLLSDLFSSGKLMDKNLSF